ncbi:Molybdenum cofactor biosynthesis protein MoaB [hydrothermal vent metagenome]|uniref:Molybdenum cofactor biosynthesis protein MoaB n=1 Tax=hydrothermal vent metagenome TaxID=652676 RepID=A0A1W1EKU0_9ZZZZ
MKNPKFFALIIGSEILNRRRTDAHFDFVSKELAKYGNTLTGSFVIEDDPNLIISTIKFIASIENSVIFSFGGIGSTPDDYTRDCVAKAFDTKLETHQECEDLIQKRITEYGNTSKYALEMAQLPPQSELLVKNYTDGIPAFHLQKRFFFMPGFPHMSHPIIEDIQKKFFSTKNISYRYTLVAYCKESIFIELMRSMPDGVDVSSLPNKNGEDWKTTISLVSRDKELAIENFRLYEDILNKNGIEYVLGEK